MKKHLKIAVLTSGGVDSSVALKLLKDDGNDITAFYLKIWLEDELSFLGDCPWEEDLKYVREICEELSVPLEIVPMQKEYFDTVVAYTLNEVKNGRTPNPDIMCNNNIKFGLFLDRIDQSYEKVATGHYANIELKNGIYYLKKNPDPIKDQTYFLANLKQEQLKRIIFPLGKYTKNEVRSLAAKFNLPNKDRKDSQGICFLGKFKYNEFIKHYLGEKKGDILEYETGKKLGEHEGFYYYTIGQRKGIHLPDGPFYVVEKNPKKNLIYVSKNYHSEEKSRNTLEVSAFNWFAGEKQREALKIDGMQGGNKVDAAVHDFQSSHNTKNLQVKLRHGPSLYNCKINYTEGNKAKLKLDGNDQGIARGQFAVFYHGDICLGSAIIN